MYQMIIFCILWFLGFCWHLCQCSFVYLQNVCVFRQKILLDFAWFCHYWFFRNKINNLWFCSKTLFPFRLSILVTSCGYSFFFDETREMEESTMCYCDIFDIFDIFNNVMCSEFVSILFAKWTFIISSN